MQLPLFLQGGPEILKGCATPDVCDLQVNTTLGLEASGFRLTTAPECNYAALPTQPGALNADSLRLPPPTSPPFLGPASLSQFYVF